MHLVSSMAYVGAEPWHGLGNRLAPKQSLEVWRRAAGMNGVSKKPKCASSLLAAAISVQFTRPPNRKCCTVRTPRRR